MKITLFFFGKKTEIEPREQELLKRINFRSKIELHPLPQAGLRNEKKNKKIEAENFLDKIGDKDFVVAFDEKGDEYDSQKFALWLKSRLEESRPIVFVIGGAYGLDSSILSRANACLRFGEMTWTRNLFRHMTLEQIYRALEINGGSNFHKN